MHSATCVSVAVVFLATSISFTSSDLFNINLDEHRDSTVILDCSNVRTGIITLPNHNGKCLSSDFFVNLRVKYGRHCRGYFRFYLSLRRKLLGSPKVTIFDSMYNERAGRSFGEASPLRKGSFSAADFYPNLPNFPNGSEWQSVSKYFQNFPIPTPNKDSFTLGQYFSNRDSIRLEITRDQDCLPRVNNNGDGHSEGLVIDFTLVQADRKPAERNPGWERYCPALHGWIPENILCAEDSRVTCPDVFSWAREFLNFPINLRILQMCHDNVVPTPEPEMDDSNTSDQDNQDESASEDPCWVNPFSPTGKCSNPAHEHNQEDDIVNVVEDCWGNPFNPYNRECYNPNHHHRHHNQEDDPDSGNQDQGEQNEQGRTRRPHQKRHRWTSHPDFDDDFDSIERNEEDSYTRRPSHHHQSWHPLSIALISMAIILGFFVLPALACCWCLRSRNRISYQTLISPGPTAPFYGTFENPGNNGYQQQQAMYRPLTPQVNMMPPPNYAYAANEAKMRPPNN